jgi:hypothetical protein
MITDGEEGQGKGRKRWWHYIGIRLEEQWTAMK